MIRYMSSENTARKFNLKKYFAKYQAAPPQNILKFNAALEWTLFPENPVNLNFRASPLVVFDTLPGGTSIGQYHFAADPPTQSCVLPDGQSSRVPFVKS
jgi:hypothetical protein